MGIETLSKPSEKDQLLPDDLKERLLEKNEKQSHKKVIKPGLYIPILEFYEQRINFLLNDKRIIKNREIVKILKEFLEKYGSEKVYELLVKFFECDNEEFSTSELKERHTKFYKFSSDFSKVMEIRENDFGSISKVYKLLISYLESHKKYIDKLKKAGKRKIKKQVEKTAAKIAEAVDGCVQLELQFPEGEEPNGDSEPKEGNGNSEPEETTIISEWVICRIKEKHYKIPKGWNISSEYPYDVVDSDGNIHPLSEYQVEKVPEGSYVVSGITALREKNGLEEFIYKKWQIYLNENVNIKKLWRWLIERINVEIQDKQNLSEEDIKEKKKKLKEKKAKQIFNLIFEKEPDFTWEYKTILIEGAGSRSKIRIVNGESFKTFKKIKTIMLRYSMKGNSINKFLKPLTKEIITFKENNKMYFTTANTGSGCNVQSH